MAGLLGLNIGSNPAQSWLVNTVQKALPQNMWAGNPIRNVLGIEVPKASAQTLPQTQKVQGTSTNSNPYANDPLFNPANYATGNSGTGSVSSPIPTNGSPADYSQITNQQASGNDQIEADYNNSMAMLGGAESSLRGQADTASASIDQQAGAAKTEIGNTQTTAESGANASLSTAEKQGTTAMQQARDLYRQTQQQNGAQLSALGISSSSVAEALAERLGVETARRIAGVTGSVQEARQNAVNELGRIKTYYQGKISDLANQVEVQKSNIQNSLVQGLNQINAARNQAASDKAAARSSLLQQTQTAIYNLSTQQQQFQQSLDQWAAQKTAALTPIVQDPNYLNNLVSTANTLNATYSPTGFNYTPSVNVNAQGIMTGQINPTKKTVDPLTELYQQAGIAQ